jgi:hypothetical protein
MFPTELELNRICKAINKVWHTQPVLLVAVLKLEQSHEICDIHPQLDMRGAGTSMKPLCETFEVEINDKMRLHKLFPKGLDKNVARTRLEAMERWSFDEWKVVVWCNEEAAIHIPVDADIVIQSWARVEKAHKVEVVTNQLPSKRRGLPLFNTGVEDCPGFRWLPWTQGTRWVNDPEGYAIISRDDRDIYSTDGGVPDKEKRPQWASMRDLLSWCTAAVVTDARWDEVKLEEAYQIVRTMEGSTQECEAYAFLEQLQQAMHSSKRRAVFIVDSMAVWWIYVAASGGSWGEVVKRGLGPYAIIAKQFMDSPELKDKILGLLKSTSHGLMLSNRSCDNCTDEWSEQPFCWQEAPQTIVIHAIGEDREYRIDAEIWVQAVPGLFHAFRRYNALLRLMKTNVVDDGFHRHRR